MKLMLQIALGAFLGVFLGVLAAQLLMDRWHAQAAQQLAETASQKLEAQQRVAEQARAEERAILSRLRAAKSGAQPQVPDSMAPPEADKEKVDGPVGARSNSRRKPP